MQSLHLCFCWNRSLSHHSHGWNLQNRKKYKVTMIVMEKIMMRLADIFTECLCCSRYFTLTFVPLQKLLQNGLYYFYLADGVLETQWGGKTYPPVIQHLIPGWIWIQIKLSQSYTASQPQKFASPFQHCLDAMIIFSLPFLIQ